MKNRTNSEDLGLSLRRNFVYCAPMHDQWENIKINCQGLSCVRGGRRVYSQLNFKVSSGQMLVLRGGNGCGKSTLLRQVAGFLPVYDGTITLNHAADEILLEDNIHYAGHLSGVKPYLSVSENLLLWSQLFEGTSDLDQALLFWGLTALKDTPARLLSEGQKRRVGLARLMLAPRQVWLLDEPNVGLDAENLARLDDAISKHLNMGGMVLMASHVAVNVEHSVELDMSALKPAEQVA